MRRDIGVHWHNKVEEKVEENKREDHRKGRDGHGEEREGGKETMLAWEEFW